MAPVKKVSQYSYKVTELSEPETGHTKLLPSKEENDVINMDPLHDPELQWAGKARHKSIPILPLQRNEIITESRIAQIIERVSQAAKEKSSQTPLTSFFELEKALRDKDKPQRVEFYKHEEQWKNKLISGDSLLVMESLLHYEGLRGGVQMIYLDPPYAIKYDSNFQQRVDSTKNDEKDKGDDILTIKAFNDTWALGIHSYLSYLQERFYLCRELLSESGSIFVQINDLHLHHVRELMDEVFGSVNFVSIIPFRKKLMPLGAKTLESMCDYLIWYAKDRNRIKYHPLYKKTEPKTTSRWTGVEMPDGTKRRLTASEGKNLSILPKGARVYSTVPIMYAPSFSVANVFDFEFEGQAYSPPPGQCWITSREKLLELVKMRRLQREGSGLRYVMYHDDFPYIKLNNMWTDTVGASKKTYVVQTSPKVVDRCILMTSDPGDLVFDPTCGSGTTASCAERWGRRWITCDTSRVAINVARKGLLSAVFKHYRTRNGGISSGFVYRTVPRLTLKSIVNVQEPENIQLVDDPEVDQGTVRVMGPFEMMTIGRYSIDDWKGYVRQGEKLENYINVICRLYRKDAAIQGASGLVHAIAETEGHKIALSVGPLSGRVTAKQISDAVEDAIASGINEIHVLGWAFEANVGEIVSKIESRGKIIVNLAMIRPDTLAEGLKAASPEALFSPYALPDVEILAEKETISVALKGVAVFDRKTRATDYRSANSGYISAWYLDEDYDGDCFVDCQMFFNSPDVNLDKLAEAKVPNDELKFQVVSRPFKVRRYKRIAVKVIDVFGNESTMVRDLK